MIFRIKLFKEEDPLLLGSPSNTADASFVIITDNNPSIGYIEISSVSERK